MTPTPRVLVHPVPHERWGQAYVWEVRLAIDGTDYSLADDDKPYKSKTAAQRHGERWMKSTIGRKAVALEIWLITGAKGRKDNHESTS